ncbi:MAG: c-type cytochrome [Sulfurimonas sp.]|nr:c-type cytochrome [Sulfurimonas sp.]
MKNIIVAVLTVVIIALMALTASKGGAYHGGEHGKVIKDIDKTPVAKKEPPKDKEQDELTALRNKAGSIGTIEVSKAYKSKCAACHGADGSGMQSGRKLMGPKLYGQSADKIYKDLIDFKAGRKENVIMKGLLINTDEEELRKFADEIGSFSSQNQDSK